MIATVFWQIAGIWGDANTPDISAQTTPIFGLRFVPGISFNPAIELLGGISHVSVWWAWNRKAGTSIRVFSRLDETAAWDELQLGDYVPGVSADADLTNRSLFLKLLLSSTVSDIVLSQIPVLAELAIVAVNHRGNWAVSNCETLQWKG